MVQVPQSDQALLDRLQRLIYEHCALHFTAARHSGLIAVLHSRLETLGIHSLAHYLQLLERDRNELDKLIEGLTTKQTFFFRLPGQFRVLRDQVLPEIEERLIRRSHWLKGGENSRPRFVAPLRLWSAACATGEEAYSIAMTVKETLVYPRAWQIEILATDLVAQTIQTARRARYKSAACRHIPQEYLDKYTTTVGDEIEIVPEIRQWVTFTVSNLKELHDGTASGCSAPRNPEPADNGNQAQGFDVIFCRNVMIYFDLAAQQRLVTALQRCLRPGGYLFTGDAELLHIYEHSLEVVQYEDAVFYRKPAEERSSAKDHGP